jgi:hypothetical protein
MNRRSVEISVGLLKVPLPNCHTSFITFEVAIIPYVMREPLVERSNWDCDWDYQTRFVLLAKKTAHFLLLFRLSSFPCTARWDVRTTSTYNVSFRAAKLTTGKVDRAIKPSRWDEPCFSPFAVFVNSQSSFGVRGVLAINSNAG